MKIIVAKTRTYGDSVSVSKPFINHVELQDASVKEIKYVSDRLPDYIDVFTKKHKQIGLAPKTNKEILAYINTNLELLLVDNEYLIGYTIGESWFCKGTFLHEDFFLRINKGESSFSNAVHALLTLGKQRNVDLVSVGTLAATNIQRHEGLASLYERCGFVRQEYNLWRKP